VARVWDRTPEFTSNAGDYTFGFQFSSDVAITVEGVWWYQATGGPTSVTARLYNSTGSTVHASGTNSSLSAGWNLVAFGSSYAASASTDYVAAVEITDVHGYDSSGLPKTSPDGHVTIPTNGGRYESGHVGYPDASSWSGLHGIDLEYEVAGTTYTVSLSGSIAPAGSLTRQTAKALAGTVAPAGVLQRLTAKLLTGATTPTSALLRQAAKALTGAITPSGAVVRRTDKALTGTVTPTGTVARLVSKTFAGGVTPAGVLAKLLGRLFGGSITPTGTVTTAASQLRDLRVATGAPEAKWHAAPPEAKWTFGPPEL
jgi:hypothetical protein